MPTLDWIGKKAVLNHHREVPFRLLKADPALSVGDVDSGNLLVQGDNLVALKALLPYYAGQVKCIYIDPPYNTGNESWTYNDAVNSPEMRNWLGRVVGGEAEDLSRHDKWLCMMYPRLCLLRSFLRQDGAIFVNIDDNEVAHLRCVMDEIFGERNFIATIIWQKKQSPQNDAINLSDMHDYILVYARNAKKSRDDKGGWQRQLIPRDDVQDARYTNPDGDPRGSWTSADYTCNKTVDERPNLFYEIVNPNTGERILPSRRRVWAFEPQAHEKNVAEKRVWWGQDGKGRPRLKKYRNEVTEGVVPSTWWVREFAGDNQEARRELRALFTDSEIDFTTPKPTRLLRRVLQVATKPGDVILDSFAGSGTTGHAVLEVNRQDGGDRRFVLIEMDENICKKVTAQRLARIILGNGNSLGKHDSDISGGFTFATLGDPLFDNTGNIKDSVRFPDLAAHVFFAETGAPLPKRKNGKTPFLGVHNGVAIYLLYNGVLEDKAPQSGNVLTRAMLDLLPPHEGPKTVFGAGCRIGSERLKRERITFRQIPYHIRTD